MTWTVFKQTSDPAGEPHKLLLGDEEITFEPGRYSIWSTTVNSFVVIDATRDEVLGFYMDHAEGLAVELAKRALDLAEGKEDEDRPAPGTFEEAVRRTEHGD